MNARIGLKTQWRHTEKPSISGPRNFFAHNNLGVLYDKKRLHDAAVSEFESAVAIEPDNAMALKNLETAKRTKPR